MKPQTPEEILNKAMSDNKPFLTEEDAYAFVEEYSFQVPYDGSNNFYNEEKAKYALAGYKAAAEKANARIAELQNDLLDAIDLKEGKGPTALTTLSNEIKKLREERDEFAIKFASWISYAHEGNRTMKKLLKMFKQSQK